MEFVEFIETSEIILKDDGSVDVISNERSYNYCKGGEPARTLKLWKGNIKYPLYMLPFVELYELYKTLWS